MKQRYLFRHGKKSDVKEVIGLIEARIEWMDAEGIRQWNVNHYRERYTESYFEQAAEARQMYVLEDERSARIVAAAILLTEDKRWGKAQGQSYYIHNLVSATETKDAGAEILDRIERLSRVHGKTHVRLDCIVGNSRLNEWYERMGFRYAGTTTDGEYSGVLREKILSCV